MQLAAVYMARCNRLRDEYILNTEIQKDGLILPVWCIIYIDVETKKNDVQLRQK